MSTSLTHSPHNLQGPHPIFAGVYALGLMVSPDNLALVGRTTGRFGAAVVLMLAVAVVVYLAYLNACEKWISRPGGPPRSVSGDRTFAGTFLTGYTLIVRLGAAALITTGLTVSSGFVFNEVFVYWFPNFGFAYIVLAISGGLHFLKPTTRARAQLFFVGTALMGLVVLTAAGLAKGLPQGLPPGTSEKTPVLPWLFPPLLLFVGFDIGIPAKQTSVVQQTTVIKTITLSIALFGGLMALWAIAGLLHVAGDRLVSTSIGHMIAAREILGQHGRIIMGVVVISGSFAAVNALFTSLRRTTAMMTRKPRVPQAAVLGAAAASAVMMAGGLAGDEILETYIRAVLLLWIGGYGLHLSLLTLNPSAGAAVPTSSRVAFMTTTALTFGGLATLTLTDSQTMLIFKIIAVTVVLALILGMILKKPVFSDERP